MRSAPSPLFFFKQKTAYELRISDWSSDVCSSELHLPVAPTEGTSASSGHPRHHGSRSEIDDGSQAQASTLLDEARQLAEAGDEAGCQEKVTAAEALLGQ